MLRLGLMIALLATVAPARAGDGPACRGNALFQPRCMMTFVAQRPVRGFGIDIQRLRGVIRATVSDGRFEYARVCGAAHVGVSNCPYTSAPAYMIPAGATVTLDVTAAGVGSYVVTVFYDDRLIPE